MDTGAAKRDPLRMSEPLPTSPPTVLIEDHGPVRVLTLNRPGKKNAIDIPMAKALAAALEAVASAPEIKAVIVTGAGDVFTAGVDLNLFVGGQAEDLPVVTSLHLAIRGCARPVIAAVNGLAIGMGVTLLPWFDLVYCAEEASFTIPFVRLGVVPEFGSSALLPRLIGRQRAAELILRARTIDGRTAEKWGLVARAVPRALLLAEALLAGQDIAAGGPEAIRYSRSLLSGGEFAQLDDAQAAEWDVLMRCYGSEENKRAARAVLEKAK